MYLYVCNNIHTYELKIDWFGRNFTGTAGLCRASAFIGDSNQDSYQD